MRSLFVTLPLAAACASAPPSAGTTPYESVRDRLSDGPTRFHIGSTDGTGLVTARRWSPSGWQDGSTPLTIASGEVLAGVDANNRLVLSKLEVAADPIEIPESVFGKPARLEDVRVTLVRPTAASSVRWTGSDDATAAFTLDLDLDWAIAINGGLAPLGTQHLPPIQIDVAVTGGGDHVDATIGVHASGELWDWAGLLEVTGLELALQASTVD